LKTDYSEASAKAKARRPGKSQTAQQPQARIPSRWANICSRADAGAKFRGGIAV